MSLFHSAVDRGRHSETGSAQVGRRYLPLNDVQASYAGSSQANDNDNCNWNCCPPQI